MGDDAEGMTVGEYVKAREARGAFVWRARGTVSGASPRYLYGYRSFVELPLAITCDWTRQLSPTWTTGSAWRIVESPARSSINTPRPARIAPLRGSITPPNRLAGSAADDALPGHALRTASTNLASPASSVTLGQPKLKR